MNTFFFELLSEEIPARMQNAARKNLCELLEKELKETGLSFSSVETHITPRRLIGVVRGLAICQADQNIEIRGPRIDAPAQAIDGFLKSQGLASLDSCHRLETPKGIFLAHKVHEKGKKSQDLLGPLLLKIIETFPWPKSMRWGGNNITWIRPLRGILALFQGEVVPLKIGKGQWEIKSSNRTVGHRFLSLDSFEVTSFEDYLEKLKHHYVLVDEKVRLDTLWKKSQESAVKRGLDINEDPELLEEVTGLVEWPCPLVGLIPEKYMSLPVEVLRTSMRVHQRYFSLSKNGKIAPYFLVIANQFPSDGGKNILEGNEKVLVARLSDALFFWEQDLKISLEKTLEALKDRVFQDKLGSLFHKAIRLQDLCKGMLGQAVLKECHKSVEGENLNLCGRVGLLSKADLATQMVREFPELQGIMGSYYAQAQGEDESLVKALKYQYSIGTADISRDPFSIVLGLADRIDTLYGFFGIEVFPTGSKDPFALRRAALGILRILRETSLEISLSFLIDAAFKSYEKQGISKNFKDFNFNKTKQRLLTFFEERLKVSLKEEGLESDLVAACLQTGWEENIPKTCHKIKALEGFLKTKDGMDLLGAFRRANNILKGSTSPSQSIDEQLFKEKEERHLWTIFKKTRQKMNEEGSNYENSFIALAELKKPLDSFFDHVVVNVEDEKIRLNRCILLFSIVDLFNSLADFSKIEKEG